MLGALLVFVFCGGVVYAALAHWTAEAARRRFEGDFWLCVACLCLVGELASALLLV